MPSQQEVTTFTLSFSGVEFTLEPDCSPNNHHHKDVLSIAKVANDQVVIDFRNFTGVLRVTKSGGVQVSNDVATSMQTEETEQSIMDVDASKTDAASAALPDAVPEEMPSPEPKEENKSPKKKGQQTLNFFNKKKDSKV
jgi:hypothetical protein